MASAIRMGYKPGKVKDIASSMGLDVEAVVVQMAADYLDYMYRSVVFRTSPVDFDIRFDRRGGHL